MLSAFFLLRKNECRSLVLYQTKAGMTLHSSTKECVGEAKTGHIQNNVSKIPIIYFDVGQTKGLWPKIRYNACPYSNAPTQKTTFEVGGEFRNDVTWPGPHEEKREGSRSGEPHRQRRGGGRAAVLAVDLRLHEA